MGRTVTAVVTYGAERVGLVGPFPVDNPHWAEVEPVVAHLAETLGVPVIVLRLLNVEGGDACRDGHVTYHVEALQPFETATACEFTQDDHPLRMPWARASGVREIFAWAAGHVTLTGRPAQRKTWNLAGHFRLPAADGTAWLKAIPPFADAEPAALAAVAEVDPGLVPAVIASAPGRLLLSEVPGIDCWDATAETAAEAVHRLATAQARISQPPARLPDRRPGKLRAAVQRLLDGPVGAQLTAEELNTASEWQERWEMLADCGLPDTLVHGDFHPGNWRSGNGSPVVLDFADAHLGNPVLDALRAIDFQPADRRAAAAIAEAWIAAWTTAVPRSRPADALRIAGPLAHLSYAVRYQEFLDNIEPSERIYHLDDPANVIRHAVRTERA
jgi:Ser/Thr protein kinase RdoA (MazF antagonist)